MRVICRLLTGLSFLFALLVELVFQLSHSFAIFSAIIAAIFSWVIASDVNDLCRSKFVPFLQESAIISADSSIGSIRTANSEENKIQINEAECQSKVIDEKAIEEEAFD
jgi:hypothetical protein